MSDREYLGVEPRPSADPDVVLDRLFDGVVFDGWTDRMNDGLVVANTDVSGREAVDGHLRSLSGVVERALYVEYAAEPGVHAGHFYDRVDGDLEVVETIGGEQFSLRAVTDYYKREYDFHGLR